MSSQAVVKFSYDPRLEDELKLTRGETVIVINKSSDGWWKGERCGQTGWFPSNYVEEVADHLNTGDNGNDGSDGCTAGVRRSPIAIISSLAPSTQTKPVLEVNVLLPSTLSMLQQQRNCLSEKVCFLF
ncbi:SH3 domain protein [Cooperia oncophora]